MEWFRAGGDHKGVNLVLGFDKPLRTWPRLAQRLVALVLIGVLSVSMVGCGSSVKRPTKVSNVAPGAQASLAGSISEVSPPAVIQELRQELEVYQPQVKILSPKANELIKDDRVTVRFQVRDLPLFKSKEFGLGPHLHVWLDDQPYQAVYDADESLVLADLAPGTHTIRAIASRPWHELFKNEGAYAQVTFHVFTKTPNYNPDAKQPLITYSRPQGSYGAEPIMLDFYLTNVPLHLIAQQRSDDAIKDWRIRATVNGQSFVFDEWQPIYLKGFDRGKNWVQLELLDEDGSAIANVFNNTVRIVSYEPGGRDTLSRLVRGELTAAAAKGIVDPNYIPAPPEPKPTPTPISTPSATPSPSPRPESPIPAATPTLIPTVTPAAKSADPESTAPSSPTPNPTPARTPSPEPSPAPRVPASLPSPSPGSSKVPSPATDAAEDTTPTPKASPSPAVAPRAKPKPEGGKGLLNRFRRGVAEEQTGEPEPAGESKSQLRSRRVPVVPIPAEPIPAEPVPAAIPTGIAPPPSMKPNMAKPGIAKPDAEAEETPKPKATEADQPIEAPAPAIAPLPVRPTASPSVKSKSAEPKPQERSPSDPSLVEEETQAEPKVEPNPAPLVQPSPSVAPTPRNRFFNQLRQKASEAMESVSKLKPEPKTTPSTNLPSDRPVAPSELPTEPTLERSLRPAPQIREAPPSVVPTATPSPAAVAPAPEVIPTRPVQPNTSTPTPPVSSTPSPKPINPSASEVDQSKIPVPNLTAPAAALSIAVE
ncbi:hypothetical protein ACQ4M4_09820 [Leptolyngbya sp. AN02str]|uniref:hypothetical protein n=1 Tax=Leptolyngbya sp. AN02str TaxID=3423363 RepID=UPI003D31D1B1